MSGACSGSASRRGSAPNSVSQHPIPFSWAQTAGDSGNSLRGTAEGSPSQLQRRDPPMGQKNSSCSFCPSFSYCVLRVISGVRVPSGGGGGEPGQKEGRGTQEGGGGRGKAGCWSLSSLLDKHKRHLQLSFGWSNRPPELCGGSKKATSVGAPRRQEMPTEKTASERGCRGTWDKVHPSLPPHTTTCLQVGTAWPGHTADCPSGSLQAAPRPPPFPAGTPHPQFQPQAVLVAMQTLSFSQL